MYLEQKQITVRSGYRRPRRGPGPSRRGAIIVVAVLAAVNYFLFFSGEGDLAPPTLEERLQAPALVVPAAAQTGSESESGAGGRTPSPPGALPASRGPATPSSPSLREPTPQLDEFGEPVGRKVAGSLRRGFTMLKSLRKEGIDSKTALPLIHAMEQVFDFRRAQVGDEFAAWLDDDGQIRSFRYVQSPLDVYEVALNEAGDYEARKVAVPTRVEIAQVGCAIKSSLYGSMARCGEGNQLGSAFIDLFAWDIDFFQDVRQGDTFRVIVEKISVDGKFLKYGRIMGAQYDGKFGEHRLVYYTDPEGNSGYFKPDGRAARKEFLKSPLKYTRVSARGGSGVRASLKKASPVIYTASAGTPVWAVASGTVVFAGESGSLGNTVTIQHDNGFTSTYGHLGELSRHVRLGALVNQKTVLGQVGQSGKASEPKLLFSMRKGGKLVRPLKMKFSEADPVPTEFREHFDNEVEQVLRDLEATPIIGVHERRS